MPTGGLEIDARPEGHRDPEPTRRARARHEVTAISFHAYPHVADHYALMPCGGSIGDGYGPLLVAREPLSPARHRPGATVAVPGTLTTAYLALRLFAPAA